MFVLYKTEWSSSLFRMHSWPLIHLTTYHSYSFPISYIAITTSKIKSLNSTRHQRHPRSLQLWSRSHPLPQTLRSHALCDFLHPCLFQGCQYFIEKWIVLLYFSTILCFLWYLCLDIVSESWGDSFSELGSGVGGEWWCRRCGYEVGTVLEFFIVFYCEWIVGECGCSIVILAGENYILCVMCVLSLESKRENCGS